MDVGVLAQKHRFHFKPHRSIISGRGMRREKAACLLPLSCKSVLIKVPRTHARTHTCCTERFIQTPGLSSHSVSVWTAVFLCLSVSAAILLLPPFFYHSAPSHCAWRVTACVFQPMFEHRAINAGQREWVGVKGWGRATQLVIDREFKVWKTGGDSLVRGEHRDVRREKRGRAERSGRAAPRWLWFSVMVQRHSKMFYCSLYMTVCVYLPEHPLRLLYMVNWVVERDFKCKCEPVSRWRTYQLKHNQSVVSASYAALMLTGISHVCQCQCRYNNSHTFNLTN